MAPERKVFDPEGNLLLQLSYIEKKKEDHHQPGAAPGSSFGTTSNALSGSLFGNASRPSAFTNSTGSGMFGGASTSASTSVPFSFANAASSTNSSASSMSGHAPTPSTSATFSFANAASSTTSTRANTSLFGSANSAPKSNGSTEQQDIVKEVEMLVSAKHLMLASPVFYAMFKHDFLEGDTLRSTGKVEVLLPDDDTAAMEIILNIVHGRVRAVPRVVTLNVLTALSILVDKYQMLEVMELYVEIWLRQLKPSLPNTISESFYEWLTIAWVFRLKDEFKHLTAAAIKGTSPENRFVQLAENLPIPEVVLEGIQIQRRKIISDTLSVVQVLIDKLTASNRGTAFGTGLFGSAPCSSRVCPSTFGNFDIDNKRYTCDGMMLGTLLKGLSDRRLWPPPNSPYGNFDFGFIALSVRALKITSLCDTQSAASSRPTGGLFGAPPVSNEQAHGQLKWLHDQVDRIESGVVGMDFAVFEH